MTDRAEMRGFILVMGRIGIEYLSVLIRFDQDGYPICMCLERNKRCARKCEKEVVERDKYRGWIKTMKQDRYGK